MPELRISTEKVCAFIEIAREVAGKVPPTTGDDTTTGDDSEPACRSFLRNARLAQPGKVGGFV